MCPLIATMTSVPPALVKGGVLSQLISLIGESTNKGMISAVSAINVMKENGQALCQSLSGVFRASPDMHWPFLVRLL